MAKAQVKWPAGIEFIAENSGERSFRLHKFRSFKTIKAELVRDSPGEFDHYGECATLLRFADSAHLSNVSGGRGETPECTQCHRGLPSRK